MKILITKPKTRQQQIDEYRANIPDKHNGAYRRAYDKAIKKQSMRAALNMKCLDCCCWQANEVKQCGIPACPLYAYRPYKANEDDLQDTNSCSGEAIRGQSTKKTLSDSSLAGGIDSFFALLRSAC